MESEQIIGLAAGLLTSSAPIPQLIKTWKSKDAKDISLLMFTVVLLGVILWTVYGVKKNDFPIIATNGLAIVLNSIMIVFKLKFR